MTAPWRCSKLLPIVPSQRRSRPSFCAHSPRETANSRLFLAGDGTDGKLLDHRFLAGYETADAGVPQACLGDGKLQVRATSVSMSVLLEPVSRKKKRGWLLTVTSTSKIHCLLRIRGTST